MYTALSHLQTDENKTIKLATCLLILASVVTFYASMSSFASFTNETGIPFGALVITAVITLLTVLSAYQYMVNKQLRYLIPYLLTLVFSVVTNTNYFTAAWQLDVLVEKEKVSSERNRLNAVVSDFTQNINATAMAFSSLSKYSEDTMNIENQYGGTCNDGNKYTHDDQQTGDGPRKRLRDNDYQILSAFADDMKTIAAEVDIVASVLVDAGIDEIYAATNKLNSIANHPAFSTSQRWLNQRVGSGQSFFIDAQTNQQFSCPDMVFSAKAQGILDMSFSPITVTKIHNSETDNSIILSIELLINMLSMNFTEISLYQVFAVIFALGVDLSVMFASHLIASNKSLKLFRSWCDRYLDQIQVIHDRSVDQFGNHQIGVKDDEGALLEFMMSLTGVGLVKKKRKSKTHNRFVIRANVARKLFGYAALTQLNNKAMGN